jgi:hypothetical protein
MEQLSLRVHVLLRVAVIIDGKSHRGYFQDFGVTAEGEEAAVRLIWQYVRNDTGGAVLAIDERGADAPAGAIDPSQREVRPFCGDPGQAGLWYVGKPAFVAVSVLDAVRERLARNDTALRRRVRFREDSAGDGALGKEALENGA